MIFRGSSAVERSPVGLNTCSFLLKSRLKNEVNSGKPYMGNPEPSFNLKVEEGVETIPSGSTPRYNIILAEAPWS